MMIQMDIYSKLTIERWLIFILSIQFIHCASTIYLNGDNNKNESICNTDVQQFMREKEIKSSLTLILQPHNSHMPCKTILSAPESHGFFVRLHKSKTHKSHSSSSSKMGSSGKMQHNSTTSCPLTIISTNDPLTPPWKIDPCMLEAQGAKDEPVRLLPGRLKVIWNHGGNQPMYKLIVTSIGKGYGCNQEGMHPCLKFGRETMLCVSEKLLCDGIRHCPAGNEYDSDEDAEMCSKFKSSSSVSDSSLILPKPIDESQKVIPLDQGNAKTTPEPVTTSSVYDVTESPENRAKTRLENRTSLTRGLSRYGPWGYLMLGMLLCGGALLVCGLWECCCRGKKPIDPNENSGNISTITIGNNITVNSISDSLSSSPVNNVQDEFDPPPSYAALFPNQHQTRASVKS